MNRCDHCGKGCGDRMGAAKKQHTTAEMLKGDVDFSSVGMVINVNQLVAKENMKHNTIQQSTVNRVRGQTLI